MAMDTEVSDILKAQLVANATAGAQLTGAADRNLTQGLGVVNTNLIQQAGSVSDDSATMAALRTAVWVPKPEEAAKA